MTDPSLKYRREAQTTGFPEAETAAVDLIAVQDEGAHMDQSTMPRDKINDHQIAKHADSAFLCAKIGL